MKTLQNNFNLNYSEFKVAIENINFLKVAAFVITIIGFGFLLYFQSELAVAGIALGAVTAISYKSLKMELQDISGDFDMSDIIEDLEKDWR